MLLLLVVIKRNEPRIAAKKSFHTRIENCKYIKGHAMQLNKLPNDDAGKGREEGEGRRRRGASKVSVASVLQVGVACNRLQFSKNS